MARKPTRRVTFDHDTDPDFSWLEQDHYKPGHPDYSPIYRTAADMRAKRNAMPAEWYTDPANHITLSMLVEEECPACGEWKVVYSLGGIDFLADSDDWRTGQFTNVAQLKGCRYLQSLARDAGIKRR